MLIAYNNDIEYKSRWYHIQTEDNGIKDGHITTTVFYSGQILDSKTTSYRDSVNGITDEEQCNAIIKALMVKQHQMFYTRLYEGAYDSQMESLAQKHDAPSSNANKSQLGPLTTTSPRVDTAVIGNSKKPDILRASQQLAGISKLSGLGMANKSLGSGSPIRRIPSQIRLPSSVTVDPVAASSIPRSKAVEAESKLAKNKAWRGVTWSNEDLSVDALVATLLEMER